MLAFFLIVAMDLKQWSGRGHEVTEAIPLDLTKRLLCFVRKDGCVVILWPIVITDSTMLFVSYDPFL